MHKTITFIRNFDIDLIIKNTGNDDVVINIIRDEDSILLTTPEKETVKMVLSDNELSYRYIDKIGHGSIIIERDQNNPTFVEISLIYSNNCIDIICDNKKLHRSRV